MGVTAEHVTRGMAIFGRVLQQVDDAHLELETPCSDWNVEALISHVVLGDVAAASLFDGKGLDGMSMVDTSILGPNPVATWRGTALAAITAFQRPGAMEQLLDHPTGQQPGHVVAGFRLVDVLAHAWDLATTIGVDHEIPDALAQEALDFVLPMVESLKGSEHFGAPVMPPDDALLPERLMALLGRSV